MYDELIERLREDKSWVEQGTTETEHEIAKHIQQAADAIEELQKLTDAQLDIIKQYQAYLDKSRWIPATERPPEKKEIYWCYTNQGAMCECRWTNDRYGFGASDRWGWNVMDVPQYQKVTHWMQLPEPPEEE